MIEIIFLGTSASAPSIHRGLSSQIVLYKNYRFLVDCGEGTQRQILRSGLGFKRLNRILLTHGHLDHYGAALQVKAWCSAPVAAYPGVPAFSQDRRNALPPAQTVRGSVVRWFYLLFSPLTHFAPLEADLLLEEGADLLAYGVDARTVLLPGHAPGSLGIITAEGDLFVGDLFVNYVVPSQPIYLSDREAWQRSYEHVQSLQPRMVYVGHGEPFPGDQLARIYPARYQFRWWVR